MGVLITGLVVFFFGGKITGVLLSFMSDWFELIFQVMYGGRSAYQTLFGTTSGNSGLSIAYCIKHIMTNGVIQNMNASLVAIGAAIACVYFIVDLADGYTTKKLTAEILFKSSLKFLVAIIFIEKAYDVTIAVMNAGFEIGQHMNISDNGATWTQFFENQENVNSFRKSLGNLKDIKYAGFIIKGVIAYLICFARTVLILFIGYSRALELLVRGMMAPIALADIYHNGSESKGFIFIKKTLSCMLQLAVVLAITYIAAAILTSGKIVNTGTGENLITNLTSGSNGSIYQEKKMVAFLNAMLGDNMSEYLFRIAIIVVQIMAIVKSKQVCDDIVGA